MPTMLSARTARAVRAAVAGRQPVEAVVEAVREAPRQPRQHAGAGDFLAVLCGARISAASAGDRVSETKAEMAVALTIVSANCL